MRAGVDVSLRSWQFWQPLWPAVFVWLCIALPSLAWSYPRIRGEDWLPWWFRAFGWTMAHCWPYSKIARVSAVFAQQEERRRVQRFVASCRVCRQIPPKVLEIEHALTHFPGEDDLWQQLWFKPPQFATQEEADRWLAAREATGEPCWE